MMANDFSKELMHYGVQGMHWGERNGPPYPLKKTSIYRSTSRSKTAKAHSTDMNRIFKTLSERDKTLVVPRYSEDKSRMIVDEGDANPILSVMTRYKDIPVSFIAAWADGDGSAEVALATNSRYHGKGEASKVVKKFMKEFADKPVDGIKTLYWDAWQDNYGSRKLAEKAGFKYQSTNDGWVTYKYDV
jgi:RimJ/RimL family protein N-acetyltransferase